MGHFFLSSQHLVFATFIIYFNISIKSTNYTTHTYNIFSDPPGAPNITGIASTTPLIENQVRRISCISIAGNPLAELKWFRGDEELPGAVLGILTNFSKILASQQRGNLLCSQVFTYSPKSGVLFFSRISLVTCRVSPNQVFGYPKSIRKIQRLNSTRTKII